MQELLYIRDRKKIIDQKDSSNNKVHDSVNAAKRESRRLQEAHGGLGRGAVQVQR